MNFPAMESRKTSLPKVTNACYLSQRRSTILPIFIYKFILKFQYLKSLILCTGNNDHQLLRQDIDFDTFYKGRMNLDIS